VAAFRQKPKEAFLPLAFQPGEMAQVDWIEDLRVIICELYLKMALFFNQ
jgi:hypothetical protein